MRTGGDLRSRGFEAPADEASKVGAIHGTLGIWENVIVQACCKAGVKKFLESPPVTGPQMSVSSALLRGAKAWTQATSRGRTPSSTVNALTSRQVGGRISV
jgi:hypothetical protein